MAGLGEGFVTSGPQCQPRASWTFPLPCLGLQSRVITAVIALLYKLLFPFASSVVCRERNSIHAVHSSWAPEPEGLRGWHEGSASHCSWGKPDQSEKLPFQCSGTLMRTRRRAWGNIVQDYPQRHPATIFKCLAKAFRKRSL